MKHDHLTHPPSHVTKEPIPIGWMRRFHYMAEMFQKVKEVPGDVVECGVGEGTTFTMLAYLIGSEQGSHMRTLRGFDSFEGFPEPVEADSSWRAPQKGEWAFPQEIVEDQLVETGIHKEFPKLEIQVIKGFFGETLPKEPDYPIALLHADGDLYVSYRDILQNFFPRVSSGGIILFDEYREFKPDKEGEKWPGASKAIDEYLAPLGLVPELHMETGKYFVVKP